MVGNEYGPGSMTSRLSFKAIASRFPIVIIGVGGMGSRIAEGLVRTGLGVGDSHLRLIDGDFFEEKNLHNQFLREAHVGKRKVEAVAAQLWEINPSVCIDMIDRPADASLREHMRGVVFLCLDSMEERRKIVEECLEHNYQTVCVIETRMDAGVGISHCFNPNNRKHQDCWWLYWYPDDQAENKAGCGGQQSVISAIYGTAALALRQFESFLKSQKTEGAVNRIYHDFEHHVLEAEVWPY